MNSYRGSLVVVRDYFESARILKVWGIGDTCIYICSEYQYQGLLREQKGIHAIGFPKSDVFKHDPSVEGLISDNQVEWSRLEPLVQ